MEVSFLGAPGKPVSLFDRVVSSSAVLMAMTIIILGVLFTEDWRPWNVVPALAVGVVSWLSSWIAICTITRPARRYVPIVGLSVVLALGMRALFRGPDSDAEWFIVVMALLMPPAFQWLSNQRDDIWIDMGQRFHRWRMTPVARVLWFVLLGLTVFVSPLWVEPALSKPYPDGSLLLYATILLSTLPCVAAAGLTTRTTLPWLLRLGLLLGSAVILAMVITLTAATSASSPTMVDTSLVAAVFLHCLCVTLFAGALFSALRQKRMPQPAS